LKLVLKQILGQYTALLESNFKLEIITIALTPEISKNTPLKKSIGIVIKVPIAKATLGFFTN